MCSKGHFGWFFCLIMIIGIEANKTRKAIVAKPGIVK
jgi:hypothetical protein